MKRSIFGFGLLAVLLLASLGVTEWMDTLHSPIADCLQQAQALAEKDPAGAAALAQQAKKAWRDAEPLSACFADHNPMEEIGQEFAQLEIFADREEWVAFAASCGSLAEKVQAMSDAHGLKWRNIL